MKSTKEKIVIYVKQHCPFCKKAKELLDKRDTKYEEIDILEKPDLFDEIKLKYNVKTVPQIFIVDDNGDYIYHIGGCDKLIDLEREGKLDIILDAMLDSNYDKTDVTTTYQNDSNEYEEHMMSHDDFM